MNRRAKLSLVPDKGVTKKQAAGFELASPEEAGQAPGSRPPLAKARTSGSAQAAAANREKVAAAPPAPRPSGRQLVKVVAVVAVVALSLLLLRRRLF